MPRFTGDPDDACPITLVAVRDLRWAVALGEDTDHAYECVALVKWLQLRWRNPLTNAALPKGGHVVRVLDICADPDAAKAYIRRQLRLKKREWLPLVVWSVYVLALSGAGPSIPCLRCHMHDTCSAAVSASAMTLERLYFAWRSRDAPSASYGVVLLSCVLEFGGLMWRHCELMYLAHFTLFMSTWWCHIDRFL
jgi:hypothetical protein